VSNASGARGEFAYDAAKPLGYVDRGRVNRRGYPIAVHDVSFRTGADRLNGFLLLPPGRGPFPGVVYLHGSGGSRRDLLVLASWLVARGAVAVRRAFDVLQSLPEVDRSRIGFVGWSAGAHTGALIASVEHRPRGFVLMSAGANPLSAYAEQAPAGLRPSLIRILTRVDPLHLLGTASRGTLLLQDGRRDQIVPHAALARLARAAPTGTSVHWYDAGHALNAKAYHDQLAWLTGKLGIAGQRVHGVPAGP
jgi:dienelactone hydrolase